MADELISRQAALNMVRHLRKYAWRSPDGREYRTTLACDDVKLGLDRLPTVGAVPVVRCAEWISVKDKLPEGDRFLAVSKFGHIMIAERRAWQPDWCVGGFYIPKDITYWMPLPAKPDDMRGSNDGSA